MYIATAPTATPCSRRVSALVWSGMLPPRAGVARLGVVAGVDRPGAVELGCVEPAVAVHVGLGEGALESGELRYVLPRDVALVVRIELVERRDGELGLVGHDAVRHRLYDGPVRRCGRGRAGRALRERGGRCERGCEENAAQCGRCAMDHENLLGKPAEFQSGRRERASG